MVWWGLTLTPRSFIPLPKDSANFNLRSEKQHLLTGPPPAAPCYVNLKTSWFYDLLNSPEVLSLSSVTDLGSKKPWSFEATCVDDDWRWNTCHRISIEPCKDSFLPDLGSFLLSEHQPPYQTVDVPMDGSCFFRYIPSPPPFFFVGFLFFVFFFLYVLELFPLHLPFLAPFLWLCLELRVMRPSCVHYAWLKWSRSGIQTFLVGLNFHSWTWPKKGSWIVVVSLTGLGMSHMMRTSSCLVNTFVPLTQLLNSFNTCPWHLQIWKILPLGHMSQRSLPWLFVWKQQLHAILIIAAVSWKIIRAGLCMLLRPVGTASPTQSFFLLTLISFTLSQSVVTKLRKFHYLPPPHNLFFLFF